MNADNHIIEKKKITAIDIIFLLCVILNFVSGIYAFVIYYHIWPKLLHVGDKLNQTGVDALVCMEKDSALMALGISGVLVCNSILMISYFHKSRK